MTAARFRLKIAVPLVVSSLLAAVSPAGATDPAPDLVGAGRQLLEEHCSKCHAIGRDDVSRHPKAPPFREVVTRYPPENLAEPLAEGIMSGHPDMPEFVFQPDEIDAIIGFLEWLKSAPVP